MWEFYCPLTCHQIIYSFSFILAIVALEITPLPHHTMQLYLASHGFFGVPFVPLKLKGSMRFLPFYPLS